MSDHISPFQVDSTAQLYRQHWELNRINNISSYIVNWGHQERVTNVQNPARPTTDTGLGETRSWREVQHLGHVKVTIMTVNTALWVMLVYYHDLGYGWSRGGLIPLLEIVSLVTLVHYHGLWLKPWRPTIIAWNTAIASLILAITMKSIASTSWCIKILNAWAIRVMVRHYHDNNKTACGYLWIKIIILNTAIWITVDGYQDMCYTAWHHYGTLRQRRTTPSWRQLWYHDTSMTWDTAVRIMAA